MVEQVAQAPRFLTPVTSLTPDRIPPSHVAIHCSFYLSMLIQVDLDILLHMDLTSLQVLLSGQDSEHTRLVSLAYHYFSIRYSLFQALQPSVLSQG